MRGRIGIGSNMFGDVVFSEGRLVLSSNMLGEVVVSAGRLVLGSSIFGEGDICSVIFHFQVHKSSFSLSMAMENCFNGFKSKT